MMIPIVTVAGPSFPFAPYALRQRAISRRYAVLRNRGKGLATRD